MRQKSRKRKKLADEEDSEEEEDPSTFSVKTTLRDVCENEQTLAAIDFIARRWATPFHYLAFEALRVFVAVLTAPPDECDGEVHQLLEREIEAVAGEGGTDAAARQRAIGLPDMGRSTWWSWLLSALTVSDSRYSRPGSGSELLRVVLGRFLFSDATGRARPGVPRLEQTGMDSVGRQMLVTVRTNLEQHMRNNFAAWLFRLCSAVVSEAAAGRQVAFGAAAVTAQAPPQEPQPCLNNDALGDPDDEWWADASAADGHSDEEDPGSNGLSRKVLDSLSRRLYAALRSDQPLVLQPQDLSAPVAVVQHMQHFLTGGRHLLRQRGLYDDAVDDARWRLSSALREHPLQYLSTAADILRALGPLHQARLQARIAACEASRQLQQQLQSAPTEDRRQQLQQQVTAAKQRVKSSKRALDDVQLFSVVPEPRMGVVHFQLTYTTAMTIAANLDVLAAARQSEASSSGGSAATVCWPRLQTVSNAQRYRRTMASQQQQARRAQISELEAELRFQRRWVKCLAGRQRKARQVLRNLAQQQMPLAPQQQLHVYHLQQQLAREQRCLQKAKGTCTLLEHKIQHLQPPPPPAQPQPPPRPPQPQPLTNAAAAAPTCRGRRRAPDADRWKPFARLGFRPVASFQSRTKRFAFSVNSDGYAASITMRRVQPPAAGGAGRPAAADGAAAAACGGTAGGAGGRGAGSARGRGGGRRGGAAAGGAGRPAAADGAAAAAYRAMEVRLQQHRLDYLGIDPGTGDVYKVARRSYGGRYGHDPAQQEHLQQRQLQRRQGLQLRNAQQQQQRRAELIELRQLGRHRQARSTFQGRRGQVITRRHLPRPATRARAEQRAAVDGISGASHRFFTGQTAHKKWQEVEINVKPELRAAQSRLLSSKTAALGDILARVAGLYGGSCCASGTAAATMTGGGGGVDGRGGDLEQAGVTSQTATPAPTGAGGGSRHRGAGALRQLQQPRQPQHQTLAADQAAAAAPSTGARAAATSPTPVATLPPQARPAATPPGPAGSLAAGVWQEGADNPANRWGHDFTSWGALTGTVRANPGCTDSWLYMPLIVAALLPPSVALDAYPFLRHLPPGLSPIINALQQGCVACAPACGGPITAERLPLDGHWHVPAAVQELVMQQALGSGHGVLTQLVATCKLQPGDWPRYDADVQAMLAQAAAVPIPADPGHHRDWQGLLRQPLSAAGPGSPSVPTARTSGPPVARVASRAAAAVAAEASAPGRWCGEGGGAAGPRRPGAARRRRRRNDRRKRRLQAGKPTQPPRYWSKKLRKLEAATAAVAAGAGGGEAAGQGAWAPLQLHWSDIRFRSRKFGVYSQSQRVLHREARRLTGGAPMSRVSIGYGNASTGHNSVIKRPSRGPHKAMQRLLRRCYARSVVMIDEYCTSQVCYNCGLPYIRYPHTP